VVEESKYSDLLRAAIVAAYFSDSTDDTSNAHPQASIDASTAGIATEDDASMQQNNRKRKREHGAKFWWLIPGETDRLQRRMQVAKSKDMKLAIEAAERAKEIEWEKSIELQALAQLRDGAKGERDRTLLLTDVPPVGQLKNHGGIGQYAVREPAKAVRTGDATDPRNPMFFPPEHYGHGGTQGRPAVRGQHGGT